MPKARLVTLIPGAALTRATQELASGHVISGASRLVASVTPSRSHCPDKKPSTPPSMASATSTISVRPQRELLASVEGLGAVDGFGGVDSVTMFCSV